MKKLLITFSFGQSLSIGTSSEFENLSPTPQHPGLVLGLDFGNVQLNGRGFRGDAVRVEDFNGFIDLIEADRETPASGMLNQIIDRYLEDGQEPPAIVHFHAGQGGRSIVELLTSSEDIYASTEDALAVVADGLHFAVELEDGSLAHYINDEGKAVFTRTSAGGTVYFDNLVTQLELTVQTAVEQGYEIEPSVVLNWIQGQSDVNLARLETFNYEYHLNLLLDKVSAVIAEVVSPDATMVASISQFRGTGLRATPIQALDVINDRDDAHLGIVEYAFQAFEPSVIGADYTHLSAEGYYRAGRVLGDRIYDVLSGQENRPILIDRVEQLTTTELLVTFSGVESGLIDDPSIYRAEAGFSAPQNFGFGLYLPNGTPGRGLPSITASELVGTNQVRLTFDQAVEGEFLLYLGRTGENLIDPAISPTGGRDFGGSTLRDAFEREAPDPTSQIELDDNAISEYAPVQAAPLFAWSVFGSDVSDQLSGTQLADRIVGNAGSDLILAGLGDDIISGGSGIDTAVFSGNSGNYIITQTALGVFEVAGADGTDTLTTTEFAQFDDGTFRLLPGTGLAVNFEAADPDSYQEALNALLDFDGNALGGNGAWLFIGKADVNGDGDIDQILVNDAIGRLATVGTADDGLFYFNDNGWAGETRVAGIYIDPLVEAGIVERFSPFDSQQRFQNDLSIENINRVLGADDYDGDGFQDVYFALTDGTAYLRAIMEADGNISYANYQSEAEVIDFLEANGFGAETYGDWFTNGPQSQSDSGKSAKQIAGVWLQEGTAFAAIPDAIAHSPFETPHFEFFG